jgi:predicted metal-dependent TIM-barrel fold hydrolase
MASKRQEGVKQSLQSCKSHNYPDEQVVQDSLPTRIIIVKATSLMLGFTIKPYHLRIEESGVIIFES